jgi:hypothetical protein
MATPEKRDPRGVKLRPGGPSLIDTLHTLVVLSMRAHGSRSEAQGHRREA